MSVKKHFIKTQQDNLNLSTCLKLKQFIVTILAETPLSSHEL